MLTIGPVVILLLKTQVLQKLQTDTGDLISDNANAECSLPQQVECDNMASAHGGNSNNQEQKFQGSPGKQVANVCNNISQGALNSV